MSVCFYYEPLPRLDFRLRQEINFFVGTPQLTFRYDTPRTSEPKPLRQPREPQLPRPPKVDIVLGGRTLEDCDTFMQKLSTKSGLKRLWDLRGSELDKAFHFFENEPDVHDLAEIRRRIRSCTLTNADDVRTELVRFFKAVENVCQGHDVVKVAHRCRKLVDEAFSAVPVVKRGFGRLKEGLRKMAAVEVPAVGHTIESFDEGQADALAARLNKLTQRQKLKAEWIIRVHWPALPFYAEGIDVRQLPATVVDALNQFLESTAAVDDADQLLLTS